MQSRAFSVRASDELQLATALGWQKPLPLEAIKLVALLAVIALIGWLIQDKSLIVVVGIVMGGAVIFAWWGRRQSRHALGQWIERHALCPAFVSWNDSGLQTGGCAHGEDAAFAWTDLRHAVESSDFVVLRMRQGPLFIAKPALDADALADLYRQLDGHRIPRKDAN